MEKDQITKELLQQKILQLKFKNAVCADLDISIYTLTNLLEAYNLKIPYLNPRKGKVLPLSHPEITREWLVENWANTTKSMEELAKEFNISSGLLEARRAKYKVKKQFKYQFDCDILFNAADPNICYLAGLIATDGYLPKAVDSFELDLTGEEEKRLLLKINNYIKSNAPIIKLKNNYRLRISGSGIRTFLKENFNIPEIDKTYTLEVPSKFANEDCAKSYIRGCIDGDGYINKNGNQWSIVTASENFVNGLHDIIYKYTNISIPVNIIKQDDKIYPHIGTTDKKARDVLNWIYSYESDFKLDRKYNNYKSYYKDKNV